MSRERRGTGGQRRLHSLVALPMEDMEIKKINKERVLVGSGGSVSLAHLSSVSVFSCSSCSSCA